MFDVVVAPSSTSSTNDPSKTGKTSESNGSDNEDNSHTFIKTPQLAFLPTKFRKLVWIKRNDFVIVECGDEKDEIQTDKKEGGGFRYVISHILYKDQVKHIKSKRLWPIDPFFADDTSVVEDQQQQQRAKLEQDDETILHKDSGEEDKSYSAEQQNDDGIVFDDPLADELMVNTNRIKALRVEDSSSDESDE